jgi:hypothetical protein
LADVSGLLNSPVVPCRVDPTKDGGQAASMKVRLRLSEGMAMRSKRQRPSTRTATLAGCITVILLLASAASASGALPEIGRCLKVEGVKEGRRTVYHGAYANSKCDKLKAKHQGKYEWAPGLGARTNFKGSGTGVILIESVPDPATVTKCGGSVDEGRLTGADSLEATITYTGCERSEDACIEQSGGPEEPPECVPPCGEGQVSEPNQECEEWVPCQSEGAAAGVVKTLNLEGTLAFIAEGRKPKVGFSLNTAGKGSIASYECGSYRASFGGLGGEIAPVDKMSTESRLVFHGFGTGTKLANTFEEPVEVRALE